MNSGIRISYDAPEAVRAGLDRVGQTEDVRFSPNNRRLALAGFERSVIALVDLDITTGERGPHVTLTNFVELSSPSFSYPHGVDFLDDETIVVANRRGNVTMLRLPSDVGKVSRAKPTPIDPPPGRGFELLNGPGSLTIAGQPHGAREVLICNNANHTITRHALQADPLGVTISDVLLRRWLDLPDGICVSGDGQWIAISSHDSHSVMLYERSPSLHENSDPDGILRGVAFPHGIRFSADARHLFVADAGTPCVHIYARDGQTWQGVQHHPAASVRVMNDEVFQLAARRMGPEHGGPKGIDIDRNGHVLATTSVSQPLAFFDISAILERNAGPRPDHAQRVSHELEIQEQARLARARIHARIAKLEAFPFYRITKPLRILKAAWWRRRH